MRLQLALRSSSRRVAIRRPQADNEPQEVSFEGKSGEAGYGSVVRRLDPPLAGKCLWPDFLTDHEIPEDVSRFTDWEPVDQLAGEPSVVDRLADLAWEP